MRIRILFERLTRTLDCGALWRDSGPRLKASSTKMLTERSFDTGPLIINYAEGSPNGAPLAVLHGIPTRWQGMIQLITPLEHRWHVFACDLRGHGKSGRASTYRAIDYFSDTATFVKRQIASLTVLLGHSGGAMAALGAAAQVPDLIRAVVLLDPPFIQREISVWPKSTNDFMAGVCDILSGTRTARDLLVEFFPGIDDARIQWFAETFSCVDVELVKVLLDGRYFEGLHLGSLLEQVACPVLMLYGEVEKGGLVRESDVEFFLAHARNGTAVQIKDTGHFLHAQQPARILDLMTQWIENLKFT